LLVTYDPTRDGNPFDWIVRAAQAEREQRRNNPEALVQALMKRLGVATDARSKAWHEKPTR